MRRSNGQRVEPTQEEKVDSLAMQIRWARESRGIDMEGVRDRAEQLAAMPKRPPPFTPT
jgi:hypothetical protein